MPKKNKKQRDIKKETISFLEGWSIEDLKEAIAELTESYASLGDELDSMKGFVSTISCALYFHSISNFALTDLLIEAGIITQDGLNGKISNSPEREKLAEYLGIYWSAFPETEKIDADRLSKWLDPKSLAEIKNLH